MLENLTLPVFARHLQTRFRVDAETGPATELELIQAEDRGSTPRQEQFSLLFRGPVFLPQHIYSLSHDQLGQFGLFLVPVGKDGQGYLYQAVFNRLAG